jgi:hypothetical protein
MNTHYLYATRRDDLLQHLLPQRDASALCGGTSPAWHFGRIATHNLPGVPLCEECKELRALAKRQVDADAERARIDAERARIQTFWTKVTR